MHFACGHATAPAWRDALDASLAQVGGVAGATLGFLYVSDWFVDALPEIVDAARRATRVPHWVGSVGIGVAATRREYMNEPAIALMLCRVDPGAFRVFDGVESPGDAASPALALDGRAAHFAIVHADPRCSKLEPTLEALAARLDTGFLVGALSSSRSQISQVADGVTAGGVSGVLLGASVGVATRLTQGCVPIGPVRTVSLSDENYVVAIDGRPALDVLVEDIGPELARDLSSLGGRIFAALPVAGSDLGDYRVRNLVGIDTQRRVVVIAEDVEPGQPIRFCRRDADAARDDMRRMLASIASGLSAPPRAGVYHSCVGRGGALLGAASAELTMIADALGDFPLVGFFGNGEISGDRVYGYTGVLTLFT